MFDFTDRARKLTKAGRGATYEAPGEAATESEMQDHWRRCPKTESGIAGYYNQFKPEMGDALAKATASAMIRVVTKHNEGSALTESEESFLKKLLSTTEEAPNANVWDYKKDLQASMLEGQLA
jgi:hypothetical protein